MNRPSVRLPLSVCKGVEWEKLPKGEKLGFGKFFRNEVERGNVPGVASSGRAQNNSTQYIFNK
jgi:hypothetical protein